MSTNNTDNKSGIFLLGAAVGAVTALMLAPFSGSKMRKVTAEKGKDLLDKAKDSYGKIDDSNSIKTTIEDLKDKGRGFFKKTKNKVKDTADKVENSIEDETL
jgi:gas vesicle protein